MSQQLEIYSETLRDQVEQQLAIDANKKELDYRRNHGITVIAYWMMKENICSIWVHDERVDDSGETEVPNGEVREWFLHPFAHPGINLRAYDQRENNNGS